MAEKVVKVNMFSALSAKKKKVKKEPVIVATPEPATRSPVKPLPSPAAMSIDKDWGDVSDSEDEFGSNNNVPDSLEDDFYSNTGNDQGGADGPLSPALQKMMQRQRENGLVASPNGHNGEDSEEEFEEDSDVGTDDDEEEEEELVQKNSNSLPLKTPSKNESKPKQKQLSKKEQKKKDMDDLDALLSEVALSNSDKNATKGTEEVSQKEKSVEEIQAEAAAAFLAEQIGITAPTPGSSRKKKKKNKSKSAAAPAAPAPAPSLGGEDVDIQKILAARSQKGKKKSSAPPDAKSIAEAEAKARQAKLNAHKKKDKAGYSHMPLK